jgi:hypothetical protein
VATFVGLGSRTTYPTFVREAAGPGAAGSASVRVGVRREWPPLTSEQVAGSLEIAPDVPVVLNVPGRAPQMLRLHSARSSAEVGDLRRIGETVPALLVRSSGEVTLTFASDHDRDTALAALVADAQRVS